MPDISEKLKLETSNHQTVRLWPEGAFFKVYERSAYLFVTKLRPYEVKRRYVEKAGCEVVSTAFPRKVLDDLGVHYQKGDGGAVSIRLDSGIDEQLFLSWRDSLSLTTQPVRRAAAAPTVESPTAAAPAVDVLTVEAPLMEAPSVEAPEPVGVERLVADRIRSFNLATATPIDCMLLLSDLQKMINAEGR
ncbi:MAG: hypothetical protein II864_07275 [Prevotella sp.]|nr:hypothetical protein [Prevotella sp.]